MRNGLVPLDQQTAASGASLPLAMRLAKDRNPPKQSLVAGTAVGRNALLRRSFDARFRGVT
jgi:hypothetical protein